MKRRRPPPAGQPELSPQAHAAILRLARLLGRQIAREQHQARRERKNAKDLPSS